MKLYNILTIMVIMTGSLFSSCEYDNYDAPSYTYSGKLICDGENFPFDSNRTIFNFVQNGYGKADGGTEMRINDEGCYKQLLFNADYKLTLVNKKMPFELPEFKSLGDGLGYDSIAYTIKSAVEKDFEVIPYYKITNVDASLVGESIVSRFSISKVNGTVKPAPAIKKAYIYLSTGTIVNSWNKCQQSILIQDASQTSIEISIPLSMYREKQYYINNFRTYAYYRVAIELEGIPDYYLFSPVKRIDNLPVK